MDHHHPHHRYTSSSSGGGGGGGDSSRGGGGAGSSGPSSSSSSVSTYHVEHLATFSTTTPQQEHITPRMALQRLFKMEKSSGIWTQRMSIQLKGSHMWILDGETSDVVERFPVAFIQQPTSFNDQNHIYNNILITVIQLPGEPAGELHIFQCVSHDAVAVVEDIYSWMRHHGISPDARDHLRESGVASSSPTSSASSSAGGGSGGNGAGHVGRDHHPGTIISAPHPPPPPTANGKHAVNVKEAVTVFNQIAAQREKKGSNESLHRIGRASVGDSHPPMSQQQHHRGEDSRSETSSFAESAARNSEDNISNERYVSILNHCFDDIERFIIRLQHAAAAMRELQIRNHKRGAAKGSGDGLLAIRARGPNEEEFLEILSKFKLAFNLLAKLKGCIHDPNAPELVHFLFTPLAIIIEAARSNEPPVDPSLVGVPYLHPEAIELLTNCCTSKEFDLWQSLGINWIQVVRNLRPNTSFQPVFTDGWAPNITEPELIGQAVFGSTEVEVHHDIDDGPIRPPPGKAVKDRFADDSDDYEDHRGSPGHGPRMDLGPNMSPSPSLERDSPQDIDGEQMDWFAELQSRGAKSVRVLFPRTANNNKELTVQRGEILEVLDDSRKWWKARNSRGQIAHVPHTIVGEIEIGVGGGGGGPQYDPRHHGPGGGVGGGPMQPSAHHLMQQSSQDDWIRRERQGKKGEFRYF